MIYYAIVSLFFETKIQILFGGLRLLAYSGVSSCTYVRTYVRVHSTEMAAF